MPDSPIILEQPAGDDSRFQGSREIFHANRDLSGDWHVWRRMGLSSWATYRRCESQEQAERLATDLNEQYRIEV
ncbi:MAG: hypothetical protein RBS39_09450 [Phycisphaerales bacterium]|jgi:hypothetical protein|nr:hypothetical protein [Phycisphaerales bacterium]